MRIENIHIAQPHAGKALVQAGQHGLSAAAAAIGAGPHAVARFGGNNKLVAVGGQLAVQDAAEIFLRAARHRAVIVRKVKISDAAVERRAQRFAHGAEGILRAEVVPQPQRHTRQRKAAVPAAGILHGAVTRLVRPVSHAATSFLPRLYSAGCFVIISIPQARGLCNLNKLYVY